ncbi:PfkB family carbohydrate kinase [Mycoplasma sp. P36-A1]|uniref:PfkB family carbohydrate kinase n=1 Tax=Mycoplasma sp. P36-A1 TaxID=3252900 RepID=UPI003C306DBA
MNELLIFGSCNIDIIAKSYQKIVPFDKNPGITYYGMGGVGRNIFESILRLGFKADFATNIGNDMFAKAMIDHLEKLDGTVFVNEVDMPTSSFTSILDENNDYYLSISSMDIASKFTTELLNSIDYTNYKLIGVDANSPVILDFVFNLNKTIFADATSAAKVSAFKPYLNKLDYLKCTDEEFTALFDTNDKQAVSLKYKQMHIIITDKEKPINYYHNTTHQIFNVEYVQPISTIGAGDCFSGGLLYAITNNLDIATGIKLGSKMSALTLQDQIAVSANITQNLLKEL